MRTTLKKTPHKITLVSSLFIMIVIVLSCTMQITPPASMRFTAKITVLDTSAILQTNKVAGAQTVLQSITYGDQFESLTDSFGVAMFYNLIPDNYHILTTHKVTIIDTSNLQTELYLFNGQLQDTLLYVNNNDTLDIEVYTTISKTSSLVISEIYYCGAYSQIPQYFHDEFLEIYNNSDEVMYLDSILICDADSKYVPGSNIIEVTHAYMYPGNGNDHPIYPGQFIVVAQDAIDHSPSPINSVNLLNADFEAYVADKGDVNNPYVEDLIQIHHKYGIDFLWGVFNSAIILAKMENPYALGYGEYNTLLIPTSAIIEGVEYKDNLAEMSLKRLPQEIDGGLTGGIPAYTTQSVERKIELYQDGRMILMDNNNSSLDFHVNKPPTPGWIEEEVSQ